MSLHFLIDGYNVIKQADFLKGIPTLKDARLSLIKIIQRNRFMRSKHNQITIVFDGIGKYKISPYTAGDGSELDNNPSIKVIFSKGESADERIKKIVQGSHNPKHIVVVTDDKEIIYFSRSVGAKTMSASEFLDKESRQSGSKQRRGTEESTKTELTYQQQETINQELRRLWG